MTVCMANTISSFIMQQQVSYFLAVKVEMKLLIFMIIYPVTATMKIMENCSPNRNIAIVTATQKPMKPILNLYTMLSFCPALNLRENIGMRLTRSAQSISDRTGMNSLVPAQGARKLSGVLQI